MSIIPPSGRNVHTGDATRIPGEQKEVPAVPRAKILQQQVDFCKKIVSSSKISNIVFTAKVETVKDQVTKESYSAASFGYDDSIVPEKELKAFFQKLGDDLALELLKENRKLKYKKAS
jgi:hypothetical protein